MRLEKSLEALKLDGTAANFRVIMSFGAPRPAAVRRALEAVDGELSRDPRSARLHALKGKILTVASRHAEARRALRRALALDAGRAEAHAWLGESYLLENLVDKAMPELDRALALDPNGEWAAFHRAAARYVMGRGAQVEGDLRVLLGNGAAPAVRAAAAAFSSLLEAKAGKYDAALARIADLRALCPGEAWPEVLSAAVHRAAGDGPAALADLNAALAGSKSAWIYLERASLEEELGRGPESLASVEAARKAGAPVQEIFLRRSRLLSGLGRRAPAMRDFERAAGLGASEELRAHGLRLHQSFKEASLADEAARVLEVLARGFGNDRRIRALKAELSRESSPESPAVLRRRKAEMRSAQQRARAELLTRRGRPGEAEAVLRAASRGAGADAVIFYELGQLLERRGSAARAEAAYRRSVALKPERLQAYFRWARLLLARGDRRGMERVLRRAERDAPIAENAEISRLIDRFQLALCLRDHDGAERAGEAVLDRTRRLKDLEGLVVPLLPGFDGVPLPAPVKKYAIAAVRAAEMRAAGRPGSPWADYIQIQWKASLDASPESEARSYRRLAAFPPERYGWMRFKGGCDLLYRGEFRAAIRDLEAARDFSSPPDWRSQCFIAEARAFQGDMSGALREFRKAEEFAGDARSQATAWKGAALLWGGDYRKALKVLDAIPAGDLSPYALCWKGAALSKLRRFRPALSALDEAIARFPDDWEARVWRAETLLRAGRAREALREADLVLSRGSARNHYALAVRGLARAALGDAAGLRGDFEEIPPAFVRAARRRLGRAGGEDGEAVLENLLESSRGLRRADVHMARWLS